MPTWPFQPNWRSTVEVGVSYRTDIITSRSGREQRRALRSTPRRSISYTVTVSGVERQAFSQFLARWQNRQIVMRDPVRRFTLTADVAAGALTIDAGNLPPWLIAGTQIMLGDQVVTVTEADCDALTFSPALLDAQPSGTVVSRAVTGYLTGTIGTSHPVSRAAEASIRFAVEPGSEPADDGEAMMPVHGGREVFAFKPNWATSVEQAFDWPVEQVDYGHGLVATYLPVTLGWFAQTATFLGQSAEQIRAIEQFFGRMRGRRGEFHMPTGVEDMVLAADLVENGSSLSVTGEGVYDTFSDDPRYRTVAIYLNDGRMIFRSVADMSKVGGNTVLEISMPWTRNIAASEVAMVSWAPVFRFNSDDLTFEWLTDEVAQAQIAMQSLEALPPEDPLPELDGAAQWVWENWGTTDPLDALDWLVNVRYPAIFFYPLAWVMVHEDVVDSFDNLVNVEVPETLV